MALTLERMTPFAGTTPARGTYGIKANTRIFKGGIVCLDSAGRAMSGDTIANGALVAVGKSSATFDNRTASEAGGAADALQVEVEYGIFGFKSGTSGDAIAAKDVGLVCYVIDDQTVGLTDGGGGARCVAGVITEVRDGQVFVFMGPHVSGLKYAALNRPNLSLPAFATGDSAPTNIVDGAVYDVPATATNSTISLPAAAADGTVAFFHADGTKNGHTLTFRDVTTVISAATTASKRVAATAIKADGKWVVHLTVGP